jgi:hypothetical protein
VFLLLQRLKEREIFTQLLSKSFNLTVFVPSCFCRLRPDTTAEDVVNTPVLLTPRGGIIKLSPLKNLLSVQPAPTPPFDDHEGDHGVADQEEEEIADDLRGPDCRPDEQGPAAHEEIVMSLNSVCHTGQQMKFSLPGVPQALTLNFSAEALQVGPIATILNIFLSVLVFYCGASKTRNLSLLVEKIHQSIGVKNTPDVFRNKSVVL